MTYLMKDDVNNEMPNGTLKTIIPSNGVVNWEGVLKSNDRPKGDHVTHFLRLDRKTCHMKFGLKMFICK
jgi:hypothetical protein